MKGKVQIPPSVIVLVLLYDSGVFFSVRPESVVVDEVKRVLL